MPRPVFISENACYKIGVVSHDVIFNRFSKKFDTDSPTFEWDSVLAWKLQPVKCPKRYISKVSSFKLKHFHCWPVDMGCAVDVQLCRLFP